MTVYLEQWFGEPYTKWLEIQELLQNSTKISSLKIFNMKFQM